MRTELAPSVQPHCSSSVPGGAPFHAPRGGGLPSSICPRPKGAPIRAMQQATPQAPRMFAAGGAGCTRRCCTAYGALRAALAGPRRQEDPCWPPDTALGPPSTAAPLTRKVPKAKTSHLRYDSRGCVPGTEGLAGPGPHHDPHASSKTAGGVQGAAGAVPAAARPGGDAASQRQGRAAAAALGGHKRNIGIRLVGFTKQKA